MKRFGMLLGLLIAVLAAPAVSAQPLPCADAYAASAEELISSIRVAEMPDGTATECASDAR